MAEVRIGIIGCGGISKGHIERFLDHPDVRIVALVDVDQARFGKRLDLFPALEGIPQFSDYTEMLDNVELDAVQINTPHTLHFPQGMNCLDHGLNVLMEKPMVCSVEHAKALIAKAKEKNKVLEIAYQRHFSPQYIYMRDQIQSGALGDLNYVCALQCQNWRELTVGTWRQIPELSGGGQLNDSGSHLLDIVLWATGLKVDRVSAFIDNRGTPVDINSALSVVFTNGAHGTFSVIGDAPVGFYEDITFIGTNGAFYYRNGKLFQSGPDKKLEEITELPEGSNVDTNFIDAILGRGDVKVPPECGLRVIEFTEAAWTSAASGTTCSVSSL
jgi:predicted dehydrogenase